MRRGRLAALSALVAQAVTVAIIAIVSVATGSSFLQTLAEPTVWLVQGATILLTTLAVLSRPATTVSNQPISTQSVVRSVLAQAGWAAGATVLVGLLLAIALGAPVIEILASPAFLIPGGIATLVAAVEAYPSKKRHRASQQPRLQD